MENLHNYAAYAKAQQLIEWRRYKEALKEAERLMRQEPEDPDVFALISKIHLFMNEYDKALHWSNQALRRSRKGAGLVCAGQRLLRYG